MKKFYHLSTCDTCKRIIKELEPGKDIEMQDSKTSPIDAETLDILYAHTKSYESLFNKRSKLYKEKGLKDKILTETDYRNLILEHYTFLKRPVFINGDQIFIGNSKNVIAEAKSSLHN